MGKIIRKFGEMTKKTGAKSKNSGSYPKIRKWDQKMEGKVIRNGGNEQNNGGK